MSVSPLTLPEIEGWLRETEGVRLEELFALADRIRRENVGEEVHLRGLIEISNTCVRDCLYCGLRVTNSQINRFRMKPNEVLQCAHRAVEFGYGTVVLQSGEDPGWSAGKVESLIQRIKRETPLAVTLSLGERSMEEYDRWRNAGADRVLLRFETSDRGLYERIHPRGAGQSLNRIDLLNQLRALGYEIGSGVMVGIPGQSVRSLASDIDLFARLDLDMIGLGPFIPNPDTPLGDEGELHSDQAPATVDFTLRVLALSRIARPDANIPSTSAIAAIDPEQGHNRGLAAGANVIMPNLTPLKYRGDYLIYPGKMFADQASEVVNRTVLKRLASIGRVAGKGPGGRFRQR